MRIDYEDKRRIRGMSIHPEYIGTEIIIYADDKKEARKIDAILTLNRKKIFRDLAYRYKREKLKFTFLGYDGFLASVIEKMVLGESRAWHRKEFRSPHKLELL